MHASHWHWQAVLLTVWCESTACHLVLVLGAWLQEVDIEKELGMEVAHDDDEDDVEEEKHEGEYGIGYEPLLNCSCSVHSQCWVCQEAAPPICQAELLITAVWLCGRQREAGLCWQRLQCLDVDQQAATLGACISLLACQQTIVLTCHICLHGVSTAADTALQPAVPAPAPKPAAEPEKQLSKKVGT